MSRRRWSNSNRWLLTFLLFLTVSSPVVTFAQNTIYSSDETYSNKDFVSGLHDLNHSEASLLRKPKRALQNTIRTFKSLLADRVNLLAKCTIVISFTRGPTPLPTVESSVKPSISPIPTPSPTAESSTKPSMSPIPTAHPTPKPSQKPSSSPKPSSHPSHKPSQHPSHKPTPFPSDPPSISKAPSRHPTAKPSQKPSRSPAPSISPTRKPVRPSIVIVITLPRDGESESGSGSGSGSESESESEDLVAADENDIGA